MDVSAGLASTAADADAHADTATATATAAQTAFEDKLRQEVILVPEDLADIHIQAAVDADTTTLPPTTATTTGSSSVASVAGRRNPRRKKQSTPAASANTVPFQTERTIEQRREQVRPIIDRLTELQMNVSYPAIRELYKQLSQFIRTGEDAKIKIPFPEFSRKIKGELSNAPYIQCWVRLEME